ncbi:M12 family metallopeptidase [Pseudidiomarina marina]|uniref:M12 family metallopeptidase n=1 Tax=Pseudidiomarina marina TaxID=502366 RepID=UPI00384E6EC0
MITANVSFKTLQGIQEKEVSLTVVENSAYFEGDIFVGYIDENNELIQPQALNSGLEGASFEPQSVVISSDSFRWPNGVVPYTVSSYFTNTSQVQSAVQLAINQIEADSGVKFVQRNGHANYIEFVPSTNNLCSSQVGMIGGRQTISLASYCQTTAESHVGVIVHEILHALGFYHMHTRADRDSYITVNYSNIRPEHHHNFDKYSFSDPAVTHIGSYDLKSIMHYGRFTSNSSFVYDTSEPMLTVNSNPAASTGSNKLSSVDKASLHEMYGALQSPTLSGYPAMCQGRAFLEWDAINRAEFYKIESSSSSSNYWMEIKQTFDTSTSVNLSSSGYVRVLACNANGECSLPSNSFYIQYYSPCM